MKVRNDVADWLESNDEQTLCDDFLTERHEFDNYLGKLALNLGYKFVTDFIIDLKRNGFVRESQTNTGMRIVKSNFCVSCSGMIMTHQHLLEMKHKHIVVVAVNYMWTSLISTAQTLTSQRTCSGRNDGGIKKT